MTKSDLLKDLNGQERLYAVLSKGYLNFVEIDTEVYSKIKHKLITESNQLLNSIDHVNEANYEEFEKKWHELRKIVKTAIYSELHKEEFIDISIKRIRKIINDELVKKISNLVEKGFSFDTDIDGSVCIQDMLGQTIFYKENLELKTILLSWGIDTEDELYSVFALHIIPENEIETYYMIYCFKAHFNL